MAMIIMRGSIEIPITSLSATEIERFRSDLTRQPKGWNDEVPDPVCCLRTENGCLKVPRYFDLNLWPRVNEWHWEEGESHRFRVLVALDPDRGQDKSVPAMIRYLRKTSGGILVSPTGSGKTLAGLAIAAAFNRKIAVIVYKGDMIDNWTEHAETVLGLSANEVGIYKEDRCDIGKPITLLSVGTLLSRGVPEALRRQIGFLIADEIHRYGARVWHETVSLFPARYRLGLSADPVRDDGLDDVISWLVGGVGHVAKRIRSSTAQAPTCIMLHWRHSYPYEAYCRWKRRHGRWAPDDPDPMKYDKRLAADDARTRMYAREIANALEKGRQILVLTRLTGHRDELHAKTVGEIAERGLLSTAKVWRAGLKKEERAEVAAADVIFATFKMSSDALNLPKLDTLFMATPPGDLTQPIGRLREKAEGIDRQPLMIVEGFEDTDYSKQKASKRMEEYASRKIAVRVFTRAK